MSFSLLYFFIYLQLLFVLNFTFFCYADINVVEIEANANEIFGPISAREDAKIQSRLGGTRDNYLFLFFEIQSGDRVVTVVDG